MLKTMEEVLAEVRLGYGRYLGISSAADKFEELIKGLPESELARITQLSPSRVFTKLCVRELERREMNNARSK